jgi:transcriptional regulator with XRE-family HTH domain
LVLAEVRRTQQLTQVEVARTMQVTQSRVSRLEKGEMDSAELGTLRKYVEALGGQLRLVVDFGDEASHCRLTDPPRSSPRPRSRGAPLPDHLAW